MRFLSYYLPKAPLTLVYMLQQVEYSSSKFVSWVLKIPDLGTIQKRDNLEFTNRAKLSLALSYVFWFLGNISVLYISIYFNIYASLLLIFVPDVTIFFLAIANGLMQLLIITPTQNKEISLAVRKISKSKSTRIAVMGSYGKTTMKELLVTVLSEGKQVSATPGNKNVLISHARWVNKQVKGDEDVVIFEFGESQPGDIDLLASFSKPDMAIITGIAPAHLDGYPNLSAIAQDFASITNFVKPDNVYVNENQLLNSMGGINYSFKGVGGWQAQNVSVDFSGTSFTLSSGEDILKLHTGLLGKHQIGPLSAVVAVAKQLGLSNEQIISGVGKTVPFEHRMQPRHSHGAWIIDDTYNGNIEGMRAGLELLRDLPGKRKIYVTPGLVDQGEETENVHLELGSLIAKSKTNKAILMQNSVTRIIQQGLKAGNFSGEVEIIQNPLEYYTNLEHFLASGDVVILQNDWPDSYQ